MSIPRPIVLKLLLLFIILRLFLSGWAALTLTIRPLPPDPPGMIAPPEMPEPWSEWLLRPWYRFDTAHYLRIAEQGYTTEFPQDSVFPPLYPLLIRAGGNLLDIILPGADADPAIQTRNNLFAALIIANLAALGVFLLLFLVARKNMNVQLALRTVVLLALFPTGFFLMAAYTESLFILFALGCIWFAYQRQFWLAGLLGLLAALTRLQGGVLAIPLAFAYAQAQDFQWRRIDGRVLAVGLPVLGSLAFIIWRGWVGLPSLSTVYAEYWWQSSGFPGRDLWTAIRTIVYDLPPRGREFTIFFDYFCLLLIGVTTVYVFRRRWTLLGVYNLVMFLFLLLPTSELKPLYSMSRYTLVFFPSFMILAQVTENPWLRRLILYPSIFLYVLFATFFVGGGWVA